MLEVTYYDLVKTYFELENELGDIGSRIKGRAYQGSDCTVIFLPENKISEFGMFMSVNMFDISKGS